MGRESALPDYPIEGTADVQLRRASPGRIGEARVAGAAKLSLRAIENLPEIEPGADLPRLLVDAISQTGDLLVENDIVVLAQKVVSKAEGRFVDLREVSPSSRALDIARTTGKDPRLVEVILSEAAEVVRAVPGVLITRTRSGVILANSGVDQSNVPQCDGSERVLLHPIDPDESARRIQSRLCEHFGHELGVIISDSVGRPWREGTIGIAIGVSGIPAILDLRGKVDREGRALAVSQSAVVDGAAAAAALLMGEGAEGRPAVVVSGLQIGRGPGAASHLLRPRARDLFR